MRSPKHYSLQKLDLQGDVREVRCSSTSIELQQPKSPGPVVRFKTVAVEGDSSRGAETGEKAFRGFCVYRTQELNVRAGRPGAPCSALEVAHNAGGLVVDGPQ